MIVTAVLARATGPSEVILGRRPRGKAAERLDDSKKLVGFGDSALGEAWARAIAAKMSPEAPPRRPSELLHRLAVDEPERLRSFCPPGHAAQCWNDRGEMFCASDELVADVNGDLSRLARKGVEVLGAYVAIVCARRLNDAAARGLSRFDLDLHAMERLALHARARAGADVHATCGKVGGFDTYGTRFAHLPRPSGSGGACSVVCEGRARSEYRLKDLGTIAFVRDADAKHLLVSMASLVGKWVRDLSMLRIVRYYREHDPELPAASGYHEPVTARFVEATKLLRKHRGIKDDCFERKRADKNAAQMQLFSS
jgi:hypothetical protein